MTGSGQQMSTKANHLSAHDGWNVTAAIPTGPLGERARSIAEPVAHGTDWVPHHCDRSATPQHLSRERQDGTGTPASLLPRMTASAFRANRGTFPDSETAWELAAAARPCLTDDQRMMVFIEIGSGEGYLAIQRILNAVVRAEFALPGTMVSRLNRWLDAYSGNPDEHRLRDLIVSIPRTRAGDGSHRGSAL